MPSRPSLSGPTQSRFARGRPRPRGRAGCDGARAGGGARTYGSGADRGRGGVAARLPADDGSFDAAVVVWVLCSVDDPAAALAELRRVLVPGGELRFYEHVRSENPVLRGVQRAGDALFWTRALGGCRTTRNTAAAIAAAGFELEQVERGFHSSSVLTITSAPYVLGVARRV